MTGLPIAAPGLDLKRRTFTLALLLGTWIPMAFFLAVGSFDLSDLGLQTTRSILIFLGLVHVPATLILYVDRGFLRLVRESPARYIYLPLALIVGSGLVFMYADVLTQAYVYLVFIAWQAFHYGRQNVGVYSFAGAAQGWRPRPAERRLLEVATLCGISGTFKVLGLPAAPAYLHGLFDLLFRGGFVVFAGVVVLGLHLYLKHRHEFSPGRTAFFFTLLLFFLPLFLSSGMDGAFYSYAIGHGIQYIAFVTVLSFGIGARDGQGGVSRGMLAMGTFIVLVGLVGSRAADLRGVEWVKASAILTRSIDFAAGIGLGATVAHFVIDAGAWKLSRPSARAYMTTRFAFLRQGPRPASPDLASPVAS